MMLTTIMISTRVNPLRFRLLSRILIARSPTGLVAGSHRNLANGKSLARAKINRSAEKPAFALWPIRRASRRIPGALCDDYELDGESVSAGGGSTGRSATVSVTAWDAGSGAVTAGSRAAISFVTALVSSVVAAVASSVVAASTAGGVGFGSDFFSGLGGRGAGFFAVSNVPLANSITWP